MDYGHAMAKSLIHGSPNSNSNPKNKRLTVPKWVLINCSKIPQITQNSSTDIVGQNPKVQDFDEKRLHWVSEVCGGTEIWFAQRRYYISRYRKHTKVSISRFILMSVRLWNFKDGGSKNSVATAYLSTYAWLTQQYCDSTLFSGLICLWL